MTTHVYLSPHFDDAVLSCGALIHRQTRAGERVVVLTVCAGVPPAGPLSDFAQALHARWGVTAEAVRATRQTEDQTALRRLGAEAHYLAVPDCIYRRAPETLAFLYASEEALFGPMAPAEQALSHSLAAQLAAWLTAWPAVQGYLPLGIGQHVDHQLTRLAAEQLPQAWLYYEDYPYAARVPETPAWAGLASQLRAHPLAVEDQDIEAYCQAVADYRSQVSSFWPDEGAMRAALREFCVRTGRPEVRLWARS